MFSPLSLLLFTRYLRRNALCGPARVSWKGCLLAVGMSQRLEPENSQAESTAFARLAAYIVK